MKPRIGITIGDINGIGPEVILKSLHEVESTDSIPVIVAPKSVLEFYTDLFGTKKNYDLIESATVQYQDIRPGVISSISGRAAMNSIEIAIKHCLEGNLNAMVTAPISKEAVNLAGYAIPGHTEFLAESTNAESVLMMLVNDQLRVALATVHIPLKDVSGSITTELIKSRLATLNQSLIQDFLIQEPKIAVLGLNPHSGDGGIIGNEEQEIIIPVLEEVRSKFHHIGGPFPADGFFGQKMYQQFDATLAMYHDQGLAPFKLLSFGNGVNFTAGLPIIRTSPDHGTAFNIAGKGIADPSSFIQAYQLAASLAHKQVKGNE